MDRQAGRLAGNVPQAVVEGPEPTRRLVDPACAFVEYLKQVFPVKGGGSQHMMPEDFDLVRRQGVVTPGRGPVEIRTSRKARVALRCPDRVWWMYCTRVRPGTWISSCPEALALDSSRMASETSVIFTNGGFSGDAEVVLQAECRFAPDGLPPTVCRRWCGAVATGSDQIFSPVSTTPEMK